MLGPFYDPFKGNGYILRRYHDKVIWCMDLDDGNSVTCTQYLAKPVVEANRRAYNESYGRRWGDGQIIASTPLDVYFKEILPAMNNGDDRYLKRWLNDPDNRDWRVFKGRV